MLWSHGEVINEVLEQFIQKECHVVSATLLYMPFNKVCVLLECFVCHSFPLHRMTEHCRDSVQTNNVFYYNISFTICMLHECINESSYMNTVSLVSGRSYVAREGYNLWRCVSAYS